MKQAAVVIDKWKLPVFKRHFDDAELQYTEYPGITEDTLVLKVKYEFVYKIQPIIEAANGECKKIKDQGAAR